MIKFCDRSMQFFKHWWHASWDRSGLATVGHIFELFILKISFVHTHLLDKFPLTPGDIARSLSGFGSLLVTAAFLPNGEGCFDRLCSHSTILIEGSWRQWWWYDIVTVRSRLVQFQVILLALRVSLLLLDARLRGADLIIVGLFSHSFLYRYLSLALIYYVLSSLHVVY